jgi:hypothetical protein
MAEFSVDSRILDIAALGERGRELLWEHGYQLGEGFVDVLSQYQSLLEASRAGRLRGLNELLDKLNSTAQKVK